LGQLLEDDVVAECFELRDESFGDALGVAFAEVIAAKVVVQLSGRQHVPAGEGVQPCVPRLPLYASTHSWGLLCSGFLFVPPYGGL